MVKNNMHIGHLLMVVFFDAYSWFPPQAYATADHPSLSFNPVDNRYSEGPETGK